MTSLLFRHSDNAESASYLEVLSSRVSYHRDQEYPFKVVKTRQKVFDLKRQQSSFHLSYFKVSPTVPVSGPAM